MLSQSTHWSQRFPTCVSCSLCMSKVSQQEAPFCMPTTPVADASCSSNSKVLTVLSTHHGSKSLGLVSAICSASSPFWLHSGPLPPSRLPRTARFCKCPTLCSWTYFSTSALGMIKCLQLSAPTQSLKFTKDRKLYPFFHSFIQLTLRYLLCAKQ